MKSKDKKDITASIRQRLLNQAKTTHRPFNETLQYYAMDRFLYRLSKSSHAMSFILKGALLLQAWRSPVVRSTMDIDMLGRTTNDETQIVTQIQEILAVAVEPDGLSFNSSSITAERIIEEAAYHGLRIRIPGMLGTARIIIQIDIGFGDEVYPAPEKVELPGMLDLPPARLLCYSRESAIAEKFEVMIRRGEINSRMKDFYDIWLLSQLFNFDGETLAMAITKTLQTRDTNLESDIVAFSPAFVESKQIQWRAFCERLEQQNVPHNFVEVVSVLREFLLPIAYALRSNSKFTSHWIASGPWT